MTVTTDSFLPAGLNIDRYSARHIGWEVNGKVATITLNRPERKNPLTFDSYAELRDLFRALAYSKTIKSVVITGAGGNFCSGGDVHDIIGPLVELQRADDMGSLLPFTRMTGDVVKAMRAAGKEAWYMLAKDEGHGFAKKENADHLFYARILFLERVLLGR